MDVHKYLARIGYTIPITPNRQSLFELHRAHMLHIPFENLDIHLGNPIVLEVPMLFDKIVNRNRGGFCYELNGLFAWLLSELGFRVTLLAARVYEDGEPGQPFDHLTLLVQLKENWLADVGFGDSFLQPLQFGDRVQQQGIDHFEIVNRKNRHIVYRQRQDCDWLPQYEFSLQPRDLHEFSAMCVYHQTSPKSSFTQKRICSIAKPDGRVTLSNDRLIIRRGSERQEYQLTTKDAYDNAIQNHFGFELKSSLWKTDTAT